MSRKQTLRQQRALQRRTKDLKMWRLREQESEGEAKLEATEKAKLAQKDIDALMTKLRYVPMPEVS